MTSPQINTLLSYLSQDNPRFLAAVPRSQLNLGNESTEKEKTHQTTSYSDTWPVPEKLIRFSQFTWQSLQEIFDGQLWSLLARSNSDLRDPGPINEAFLSIHDEDSLDALLVKHVQTILLESLGNGLKDSAIEHRVKMVRGGQAMLVFDHGGRKLPDWALRSDKQEYRNICPGDTKPSWVFNSSRVEKGHDFETGDISHETLAEIKPIRQVLEYGISTLARHAFIITDEELFVLRFSLPEERRTAVTDTYTLRKLFRAHTVVEYTKIPWQNGKEAVKSHEFTIILALFFLALLAANDGELHGETYHSLQTSHLAAPQLQMVLKRYNKAPRDSLVSAGRADSHSRESSASRPTVSQTATQSFEEVVQDSSYVLSQRDEPNEPTVPHARSKRTRSTKYSSPPSEEMEEAEATRQSRSTEEKKPNRKSSSHRLTARQGPSISTRELAKPDSSMSFDKGKRKAKPDERRTSPRGRKSRRTLG